MSVPPDPMERHTVAGSGASRSMTGVRPGSRAFVAIDAFRGEIGAKRGFGARFTPFSEGDGPPCIGAKLGPARGHRGGVRTPASRLSATRLRRVIFLIVERDHTAH